LAEGLAKHLALDATAAYAEAERWLARLERQLATIPVKQRLIDGRMADFSRLSAARYRYQTEMRGRQPERVKIYLDGASQLHARQSFADLANEPGMPLLSPVAEVFYGADSLSPRRRQRAPVDLSFNATETDGNAESAKDEIRRRNLNVLTPQRAARFIELHLPAKGDRVSTENLRILAEDDLLDLLAVLAFDRGPANGSHRTIRWRIHAVRADFGTEPTAFPATSRRTVSSSASPLNGYPDMALPWPSFWQHIPEQDRPAIADSHMNRAPSRDSIEITSASSRSSGRSSETLISPCMICFRVWSPGFWRRYVQVSTTWMKP